MLLLHCFNSPIYTLRVGLIQALGGMGKITLIWLLLALCACAQEEQPTVGAEAPLASLGQGASISDLPEEIQQALTSLCGSCTFADAGAPWNSGDVIVDDRPQRRLTSIEHRGSEWLISYEHGGIGKHNHIIVLSQSPTVHLAQGSSCIPTQGQTCEW